MKPPNKICPACKKPFFHRKPVVSHCSYKCGHSNRPVSDPISRFWSKVDKTGECWTWMGSTRNGYGLFYENKVRRNVYAHRFAWVLQNGPIPKGLCVLHRCDNRPCVRHLFLGTKEENSQDMVAKGRNRPSNLKGSDCAGSKLTEAQVLEIRASTESQPEAARRFGVSQVLISRIRLRGCWKHV